MQFEQLISKENATGPAGFKANYFDDSVNVTFDKDFKPGYTIMQLGAYMKDLGDKISQTIVQSYSKQKANS